jgi:hypothetical protein
VELNVAHQLIRIHRSSVPSRSAIVFLAQLPGSQTLDNSRTPRTNEVSGVGRESSTFGLMNDVQQRAASWMAVGTV